MAGNLNSGRDDIYTIIRDAYLKADPSIPIYELDIDYKYIQILERWIFIDTIRSKDYPKKSTKEILKLWMRKFNLSEKQFYNDKKNCEKLFGTINVINKNYERLIAIESYDRIYSLALTRGDLKSALKALELKQELLGLNDNTPDDSEGKNTNKTYNIVNVIQLDGKKIAEKKIDITSIQNMDYKQIKDLSLSIETPEAGLDFISEEIDKIHSDEE